MSETTQNSTLPETDSSTAVLGMSRSDRWVSALIVLSILGLSAYHWIRLQGTPSAPIRIERLPRHDLDYRIDINSATWVEFANLSGIGQKLAQRIVADRDERGPFASVDDLQRVKGIGPKTVGKLRPHLMLGDASPTDQVDSAADSVSSGD